MPLVYRWWGQILDSFVPWHSGIRSTLPLTKASVSADSSCLIQSAGSGPGVHGDWLSNNESIADQLSDGLAGVRILDFAALRWVKPDLALTTADD